MRLNSTPIKVSVCTNKIVQRPTKEQGFTASDFLIVSKENVPSLIANVRFQRVIAETPINKGVVHLTTLTGVG